MQYFNKAKSKIKTGKDLNVSLKKISELLTGTHKNAQKSLVIREMQSENYSDTAAKSLLSCPTLCDPIGGSPPGSPVPGILQARTLGWGAISFSNAWKWKVKGKSLSRIRLLATPWTTAYQAPPSMGFSWALLISRLSTPFKSFDHTILCWFFPRSKSRNED